MREKMIFIGCRGVGKTTIGQAVANKIGWTLYDTDEAIKKESGRPVHEIVANSGWERFREIEYSVLTSLGTLREVVVATGGGAVLHTELWPDLLETSTIFWLNADIDIIKERIFSDTLKGSNRPSLTGSNSVREVEDILKEREPLYRKYSHIEIDTGQQSVETLSKKIIEFFHHQ